MTNFDGKHPDKMPDLVFFLNRDSLPVLLTHDALVAECKPVDKNHPAGGDYCDKGLRRFVIGDYAWPMQEAMMVGYVRDGRSIAANLLPAMAQRRDDLGTVEEPKPVGRLRGSEASRLHARQRSLAHLLLARWPWKSVQHPHLSFMAFLFLIGCLDFCVRVGRCLHQG